MPEIRGLPEVKEKPGQNPLRVAVMKALRGAANDPTALEVGPLGMVRALKGIKVFHGTAVPTKTTPKYSVRQLAQGLISPEQYEESVTKMLAFQKFEPSTAGLGAGGDLYDDAIYLTESPQIAANYARGQARGGKGQMPLVRTQNLPPQTKLLDIHSGSSATWDKFRQLAQKKLDEEIRIKERRSSGVDKLVLPMVKRFREVVTKNATPEEIVAFFQMNVDPQKKWWRTLVTEAGYDGVSYQAGRVLGLPKGVPETTRNFAIYNYDIINNPRSLVPKPKPQPEKALRRFPSARDKHMIERRQQAKKVEVERRRPTREEVEMMLKKRGLFSW